MRNDKGFTLIELAAVLAVLAVLAAMGGSAMAKHVNYSKRTEALVALGTISRMQDAFYQERGRYAATLDDLGFGTDAQGQGRRYRFAVTALDGGNAYVTTAIANLDGDAFRDLLFVARGAGYRGAIVLADDDITNLAQPVKLCFAGGTNDRNGDGNGNSGRSGTSRDRNGDGNGNAGRGGGGGQSCFTL